MENSGDDFCGGGQKAIFTGKELSGGILHVVGNGYFRARFKKWSEIKLKKSFFVIGTEQH